MQKTCAVVHALAMSARRGAFTLFPALKMRKEPLLPIILHGYHMGLIAPEEQATETRIVPTIDAFAVAINK
jgi:hypothetical protein